jgi:flagellar basal body-associated protein FliL
VRPVARRVLVLWIVAIVLAAIAGAWYHRLFSEATPAERAREEAERIRDRVRELTH